MLAAFRSARAAAHVPTARHMLQQSSVVVADLDFEEQIATPIQIHLFDISLPNLNYSKKEEPSSNFEILSAPEVTAPNLPRAEGFEWDYDLQANDHAITFPRAEGYEWDYDLQASDNVVWHTGDLRKPWRAPKTASLRAVAARNSPASFIAKAARNKYSGVYTPAFRGGDVSRTADFDSDYDLQANDYIL